jgi:PPK2 family polyphosphate:nucleotide phosphotransferase
MSQTSDLPALWTREPHVHLAFREGDKVADIDTKATPGFRGSKSDAPALQAERNQRFADLQEMLYANYRAAGDTRSVLLILQGMDTAGKGGIVKHVVGAANPQGIEYEYFGKPTEEELAHHYLWRIRKALPTAGHIGVFDRSHYEDVLVVRVHRLATPEVVEKRYGEIARFEAGLADQGYGLVKCFLHISYDEQRERLLARLADPDKHWKFNEGDLAERRRWADYQEAYRIALERCSTPRAPWYAVPADRKWYRNWAIGRLLLETVRELDPQFPRPHLDVKALTKALAPPN